MPDRPLTATELTSMFEATDNAELARQERALRAEQTDRLAEIQARAAKATRGPWEQYDEYGPNFYANVTGSYLEGIGDFNFGEGDQADADREFTINARTDVDWLIDQLAAARIETARLEGVIAKQAADKDDLASAAREFEARLATAERQAKELGDEVIRLRDENAGYEKCFAPDGRAA